MKYTYLHLIPVLNPCITFEKMPTRQLFPKIPSTSIKAVKKLILKSWCSQGTIKKN